MYFSFVFLLFLLLFFFSFFLFLSKRPVPIASVAGISPGDLFVEVSQLFVSDSHGSS